MLSSKNSLKRFEMFTEGQGQISMSRSDIPLPNLQKVLFFQWLVAGLNLEKPKILHHTSNTKEIYDAIVRQTKQI